jgi:hypothetical protein
MAVPPPPPGFVLEGNTAPAKPKRTVSFDWVGEVPPEVKAVAEAYAAADAAPDSPDVPPPGFQLYGPGPGASAGQSEQQQDVARMDAMRELGGPGILPSFASGALYGVTETGAGANQLASRFLDAVGVAGQPGNFRYNTPEGADALARRLEDARLADPGLQSGSGKAGRFTGGMAATAPMAYASIPAKGAGVLSWLGSGALGGGLSAATQPTYGDNFVEDKTKQVGLGALIGGGIPAAGRGGLSMLERLYTPNAMAQVANLANKGANAKPFAQEGEDLATRTGVRMTPGQVSGSKVQTALENMSRQSIFSADRAFEADQRVAGDAVKYVNRLMDNITKNPASEAAIGTQIQSATRGAVVKIAAKREEVAAAEYGALDAALGNRKFVQPDNAIAEADAIIREYGSVATPEAARIVKQAETMKAQLQQNGGLTFTQAQRSRGYYGRGARGAANVFDEVNPDINRRIATRLFKAFDQDIEQSSARLESGSLGAGIVPGDFFRGKMGPGGGNIADAIRRANGNYRKYSQLIEATESHPIARLFGDNIKIDDVVEFDKIAPEVVIDRLGKMKPTELKMVREFMEGQAPEAWQQYKRLMVEKALESARTLPTSMGANTVPFNASAFVRALGGDKAEKVKQLQATFSASEMRELDDAFRVARRLGDNFGRNNSGTGPYTEAMNFFQSLKSRSVQALSSSAGEALGLRKIANVMLNAEGRKALIELSKVPPGSRQATSLLGVISALAVAQPPTRGHNPQRRRTPQQ